MIEVSYLREYEKVRDLPKEVQETIQGILQIIISKITIKNKKNIESIELHFVEKVQKYFYLQ